MFCTECGTKLPDGAKFCFQCGASINSNNSIQVNAFSTQSKLVPMKCTNCGGYVEFQNNLDTARCPFCNSTFIVERAIKNFTSSNGGRDYNLLIGLAESNIKSKLYLDALDYLWQAHILASLSNRQKIKAMINELLDKAFIWASMTFKIYLLKYKALHGLMEVDSNFIRRIRAYEYSLKNTYLCSKAVNMEGHGFLMKDYSFLYLSYNVLALYQKESNSQLVFNRKDVENFYIDRDNDVFSFEYNNHIFCFKTEDPNYVTQFIKDFENIEDIYIKDTSVPECSFGGKYAPLLIYLRRVVEQNESELDNLIFSDNRCSYTPFYSLNTSDNKRIICYDDEIQVWKQSKYLRPWEHKDISKFDYYRIDKIDKIEIKETSFLTVKMYEFNIYINNDKSLITMFRKDEHDAVKNLYTLAEKYRSKGVNVSM